MKKFIAAIICVFMTACLVAGATQKSPEKKMASTHALSMAGAGAAMMGKPSSSRKAAVYNQLRKEFGNDRVIADSYLRMEAYLENGKSEYVFSHRLLGTEAKTEHKLNEQDAFRVTDLGIFLLQENTAKPGIGVLQTYPNPIQFPDEAGYILNADLEHIYNGFFQSKVGDTIYVPDMPIMDCRVVNTAQQTALATNDSEKRPGDGFMSVLPTVHLKGRENNELKLIVPASSNLLVQSNTGTYKIKVVMLFRGYKVTGAGNA